MNFYPRRDCPECWSQNLDWKESSGKATLYSYSITYEGVEECFTDDFTARYEGPHPDIEFSSPEEMVATNREMLAEVPTVHQGHMPEIELTGPGSARGTWAMYDRVELPGAAFEGWGHYHETYCRHEGVWLIARMHITRLKIQPLELD